MSSAWIRVKQIWSHKPKLIMWTLKKSFFFFFFVFCFVFVFLSSWTRKYKSSARASIMILALKLSAGPHKGALPSGPSSLIHPLNSFNLAPPLGWDYKCLSMGLHLVFMILDTEKDIYIAQFQIMDFSWFSSVWYVLWSWFYQLFSLRVFCCVLFIRNWEFGLTCRIPCHFY